MSVALEKFLEMEDELSDIWRKVDALDIAPEDKAELAGLVAAQAVGAAAGMMKEYQPEAFADDDLPQMVTHIHNMIQNGFIAKAALENNN